MVHVQVGKELPDMRQNEKSKKFITGGDAVRTASQLNGEPTLRGVLSPLLYPGHKEGDRGLAGHLLIG